MLSLSHVCPTLVSDKAVKLMSDPQLTLSKEQLFFCGRYPIDMNIIGVNINIAKPDA